MRQSIVQIKLFAPAEAHLDDGDREVRSAQPDDGAVVDSFRTAFPFLEDEGPEPSNNVTERILLTVVQWRQTRRRLGFRLFVPLHLLAVPLLHFLRLLLMLLLHPAEFSPHWHSVSSTADVLVPASASASADPGSAVPPTCPAASGISGPSWRSPCWEQPDVQWPAGP
jgi:hypothetical protein